MGTEEYGLILMIMRIHCVDERKNRNFPLLQSEIWTVHQNSKVQIKDKDFEGGIQKVKGNVE